MKLFSHHITPTDYPLKKPFTIARGTKTHAEQLNLTVSSEGVIGRAGCIPYKRYGETRPSVTAQIIDFLETTKGRFDHALINKALPAGAARNALDCALWDYHCKKTGRDIYDLTGFERPQPLTSFFTLSLDSPAHMAHEAHDHADKKLFKMKLAGDVDDTARVMAVAAARPDAQLIVDANEGFTDEAVFQRFLDNAPSQIVLIEQPFPTGQDDKLSAVKTTIPLCADESFHDRASFDVCDGLYTAVNIKLDKTGGLTEAIAVFHEAKRRHLKIMLGCMVASSLALAPLFVLAAGADFIDMDGSLLLAQDDLTPIHADGAILYPPALELWG